MDKNYYEILQINTNASPEIIEKAYKTLAKKYHPDLQDEGNKKSSEEVLKIINEAYEVLSDPNKKAIYDEELKNSSLSQEDIEELYKQNEELKNKLKHSTKNSHVSQSPNMYATQPENIVDPAYEQELLRQQQELEYQQQLQQAREKAYYDAYIQDLKNRGYKIRYKKSIKDYIKGFISITVLILVFALLWQIPFIRDFFVNMYNENEILQYIVNLFNNKS